MHFVGIRAFFLFLLRESSAKVFFIAQNSGGTPHRGIVFCFFLFPGKTSGSSMLALRAAFFAGAWWKESMSAKRARGLSTAILSPFSGEA